MIEIDHGWCTSIYANDPGGTLVEFCCTTRAFTQVDVDEALVLVEAAQPPLGETPPSRSTRRIRSKPRRPSVRRGTMADVSAFVAAPPGVRSAARGPRALGGQVDDEPIRTFLDGEYARVVATVALVAAAWPPPRTRSRRRWRGHGSASIGCDPIDRLPAWITTVALNLARSQMRRWRSERRARRPDRGPLQDDRSDAPGASGDAHACGSRCGRSPAANAR